MALSGGKVERRDIMGSVSIFHLDGLGPYGKSKKLVTQTNSHDRDGRGLHQASQVVDGLSGVSRIAGPVGNEHTVIVLSNLVDRVVVREDSDGGSSADEATKDVLLHAAIKKSNVESGTGRLDNEGSLGADTLNEVNLAGVNEALILISIVLVTNGDSGEGRTLLSQIGDDLSGIHARDSRNTLSGAPLAQALNSCPMAVLKSDIGDDNTSALDVRRLEVLEQVPLVSLFGWNTIISDQWLGED